MTTENTGLITLDDFIKCDIRVGTVVAADRIPGSKLLKLSVDFGEDPLKYRTILAGIGKDFEPSALWGKQFAFVVNLPPREMKGEVSEGMILAAKDDTGLALFSPTKEGTTAVVRNGSRLG